MIEIDNPFKSQNIEEVPLPNAPLVRVIAQVRFPAIVSIEDAKFIAGFQESLRGDYPILRSEKSIMINILNIHDKREQIIWRFFDKNEKWRITLAPDFLAIEAFEYKSREDFFKRFKLALETLVKHFRPVSCERIGVRYVDQIKGPEFKNVANLVRAEVLDVYGSNLSTYVSSSLRQTVFNVNEEIQMSGRWGVLGKMQTYDPSTVDAIAEDSWILDLDVFSEKKREFNSDYIFSKSNELSKFAYSFFRWTVKNEFLTTYGGKLK